MRQIRDVSVLASVLDTSPSTVRKWEVGDKRSSGPSQKRLDLIERKGRGVSKICRNATK